MSSILGHVGAIIVGVILHVACFNRGEHHLHAVRYVQAFLVLLLLAFTTCVGLLDYPQTEAIIHTGAYSASLLSGLSASLVAYRLVFSPLNKYPGPYGARLSDFWLSFHLSKHDAFKQILSLHEKYGEFVRVGSNTLSVAHPDSVEAVYGLGSKCRKAPWYDLTHPMVSLQSTRDRAVHDRRRRVWSTAFGDKALRGYEERICDHQDRLSYHIDTQKDGVVDVTQLFNFYSFDVMGDLAFGTSFDMLAKSKEHWAIELLNKGLEPLGYVFPVWFFRLMVSVPRLADDWWRFITFCAQKAEERIKGASSTSDIMTALAKSYNAASPSSAELAMLRGDAQLIVVAGSDTTSTTLAHVFYELARHPDHIQKLRKEIQSVISSHLPRDVQHQQIQHLDHLNGVINEALRLHPPVPTAVPRITPAEGLMVGDNFIPGDTTIWCPQYVLGRTEKIYSHASSFIPERWYSNLELIRGEKAFAPFSTGPYGCIGRPLALMNLRTTVAKLLLTYEFAFAAGETGGDFESKAKEHFTLAPGSLRISFKHLAKSTV